MVTKGTGGGIISRISPPSIITPDQMPGLRAWYKMDAQPYTNGESIGIGDQILDSSGNSLHLDFDIGGNYNNYANYVASDAKFNGHPSINGQFLFKRELANGDLPSGNAPFAMYAVVHKTTFEWNNYPSYFGGFAFGWGANGTRAATSFVYAEYVAGGPYGFYVDMVNAGAGGATISPPNFTYILAYSYNGGPEDFWPMFVNNVNNGGGTSNGSGLNIPAQSNYPNPTVPAHINLGGKPGYGWSWVGSIAEAIAFADYHDATKMNQVRNYLNNKYQAY